MTIPNVKVVIVDDHETLRESLAQYLQLHGFTILFDASNGMDCIDKLLEAEELPDVCVVDMEMPILNGPETIERIKHIWPTINVVALSNFSFQFCEGKAIASGADAIFQKDCDPGELISKIWELGKA